MNSRIKELRKTIGMTQIEFGKRIGIKGNSLSDIESGKNNVTETMAIFICKEFNVSEEWLRTGEGEMFVKLNRENEIAAFVGGLLKVESDGGFKQKFIHMLSRLEESDWETLEKMADLIVDEQKNS